MINIDFFFRVNSRHTLVDKGSLGIEIRSFVFDIPRADGQPSATPVVFAPQPMVSMSSLESRC